MLKTSLCYITQGDQVLMLHRVKKEKDINKDKWIGIGGKFLPDETPQACVLREAFEETGLTLTEYAFRGIVDFYSDAGDEQMYLFTATDFEGDLKECDEGDLQWVSREFLYSLPMWEGDRIFLDLLWQNAPFFRLELHYEKDRLLKAVLDGKELTIGN
ncbi:MAG: 8-oxo-dGTP diphosphatase [Oscillospiraceae bacterium]|nr:8-oxo-dGTP diphosphatase [Oscillospiraceae bacterium]